MIFCLQKYLNLKKLNEKIGALNVGRHINLYTIRYICSTLLNKCSRADAQLKGNPRVNSHARVSND